MPGYPMAPNDPNRLMILKKVLGESGFLQPSAPAPAPVVPTVPANDPTGGRSVDEAVSQGFRPPNYVPSAQIAGGSGDYMSRVPSPQQDMTLGGSVPPAQVEGSSGNYMSQIGNSPATPPAPIPETQDTSNFSFFGKPEATDALTAFASGMLRGNTFNDGLANAAEGVNKVAKDYRPLTPREIALYEQKARLQRKAQGNDFKVTSPVMGEDDTMYYPGTDSNGNPIYYNTKTGKIQSTVDGAMRPQDMGYGQRSKDDQKLLTSARDAATTADDNIKLYDDMLQVLPTSGTGPDLVSNAKRAFVTMTGISLDGVDLKDMQQQNTLLKQVELQMAQTQKGLGALTEAERDILRGAFATMDSDPAQFRRVVEMFKTRAQRSKQLYSDWMEMPSDVKSNKFNGSFENFSYFWRKQNPAVNGAARQPLDQIFGN